MKPVQQTMHTRQSRTTEKPPTSFSQVIKRTASNVGGAVRDTARSVSRSRSGSIDMTTGTIGITTKAIAKDFDYSTNYRKIGEIDDFRAQLAQAQDKEILKAPYNKHLKRVVAAAIVQNTPYLGKGQSEKKNGPVIQGIVNMLDTKKMPSDIWLTVLTKPNSYQPLSNTTTQQNSPTSYQTEYNQPDLHSLAPLDARELIIKNLVTLLESLLLSIFRCNF